MSRRSVARAQHPPPQRGPSTAHARARMPPPPRRVSGPSVRGGAVALPAPPRRGTTGVFERVARLPDHRMVDRLLRGRAWIWVVGILLGGIVAMQVSLLKLNAGISRAVEASATLQRQNSDLEATIARLSSGERIRAQAEAEGMIMPPAGQVGYLRTRPGIDVARAAARMQPPSDAARQLMADGGILPGAGASAPVVPTGTGATAAAGTGTTAAGPGTGAAATTGPGTGLGATPAIPATTTAGATGTATGAGATGTATGAGATGTPTGAGATGTPTGAGAPTTGAGATTAATGTAAVPARVATTATPGQATTGTAAGATAPTSTAAATAGQG